MNQTRLDNEASGVAEHNLPRDLAADIFTMRAPVLSRG